MKRLKSALCLLLACCFVVGLLPTVAFAGSHSSTDVTYAVEGGNIYFDPNTGTITDCDSSVTAAVIPSEIDGIKVTAIGSWAFEVCSGLSSITIPDSVTSIGRSAFDGCSSLSSITIPDNVKEIGLGVFSGCTSLEEITIPKCIFWKIFGANNQYYWENSGEIPTSLKKVTLLESWDSISSYMFNACSDIQEVTLPNTIRSIGSWAFVECAGLRSITIPNSVTSIGTNAFSGCTKLASVIIPNGVTSIGEEVFRCCSGLVSVTIQHGVTTISDGMFEDCNSLASITIPDSVTSIGNSAFDDCSSLTDVYYSGSEEQWKAVVIDNKNDALLNATIHYNSTGSNTPDTPTDNSQQVHFLSAWDAASGELTFDYNKDVVSPFVYKLANGMNTAHLDEWVNRYVLVTTKQGESVLEHIVTAIQPVDSAVGTVTAVGENSLTIGEKTYPVQDGLQTVGYENQEVLYHTNNGKVVALNKLEEKHGQFEEWNKETGVVSIEGEEYPTNSVSDLSFEKDVEKYKGKNVTFLVCRSGDYCPLIKISGFYYAGGKLEDFEPTIYHAKTWAKDYNSDLLLVSNNTPSRILLDALDDAGVDGAIGAWLAFTKTFDTLDDITTLTDLASGIEQEDVYSALIMTALQAKTNLDIIPSQTEEALKLSKSLVSTVSDTLKANYGIELNDSTDLLEDLYAYKQIDPSFDPDEALEEISKSWFKDTQPDLASLGKSFKWVSEGVKTVKAMEDVGNYITSCILLAQSDAYIQGVLSDAYQESKRIYGANDSMTRAFKKCVDTFKSSSDEMFKNIEAGAVTMVCKQGADYLVGKVLWKKVTDKLKVQCPELAILQAGYSAGKTISNLLCNTDDVAEQYIKMKYTSQIESILENVYADKLESTKKQAENLSMDAAGTYLSSSDLTYAFRDLDCDVAYKYVDELDSAGINKIQQLFGKGDGDGLERAKKGIQSFKALYRSNHVSAETMWIYSLEDDFPGSGLYEQYEPNIQKAIDRYMKKEITAACPVNVYVYNAANALVASVEDGRVSCSVDDLAIVREGDQKTIRFYNDADYRVEYKGYDTGTMDITVSEFGKDDIHTAVREVNYYDVPLTKDTQYSMSVEDETMQQYTLTNKADNSEVEQDYDSMDTTAAKHTVKVISGTLRQNGNVLAETTAAKGESLPLTAYVPDGYEFVRWESTDSTAVIEDSSAVNTTLIMPDGDVTITAVMKKTGNTGGNTGGGGGAGGAGGGGGGGSVTPTPTPTPTPKPDVPAADFVDVPDDAYYAEAVAWAVEKGVTTGTDATHFSPDESCTRAQMAVFLWRAAGSPAVSGKNPFADVPADAYYANAVTWAVQQGITTGTDATHFSPEETCTRAQMATFLYRHAKTPAVTGNAPFADTPRDAYYYDAVRWAVEKGVTTGTSDTTFSPDDDCTRAQIVTFLYRLLGK